MRLLEEIRDLMQRNLEIATLEHERAKRSDEERTAVVNASLNLQRAHGRFYRRVVAASAIILAALVIYLFNLRRE